jgi:hypothetical protein
MPSLFAEVKAARQFCIYQNVVIVLGAPKIFSSLPRGIWLNRMPWVRHSFALAQRYLTIFVMGSYSLRWHSLVRVCVNASRA